MPTPYAMGLATCDVMKRLVTVSLIPRWGTVPRGLTVVSKDV